MMEVADRTRRLVGRFYEEAWNAADESAAREILDADFRFRGSLGAERRGPDGFIAYMRDIHAALADYRCTIDDMIVSQHRAAVRSRFRGVHRGSFLGVAATGRHIAWAGAAFFTVAGDRLGEAWVLGDVDTIRQQLGADRDKVVPS